MTLQILGPIACKLIKFGRKKHRGDFNSIAHAEFTYLSIYIISYKKKSFGST